MVPLVVGKKKKQHLREPSQGKFGFSLWGKNFDTLLTKEDMTLAVHRAEDHPGKHVVCKLENHHL